MKRREFLQIIGITSIGLPFLGLGDFIKKKSKATKPHGLYSIFKEKILDGDVDWENDTVKVALVNNDNYTPDLINDKTLDDIPKNKIVKTSYKLTGKTQKNAVFDADDIWIPAVTGGTVHSLVLYDPNQRNVLVACISNGVGLPLTPNGGDVRIEWDNGPDKIVKL